MTKKRDHNASGMHKSQARGQNRPYASGDVATESTLDRLEKITGGAEEPLIYRGDLAREANQLDASTEEEVDALRVNLTQDTGVQDTRNGTGKIADDLARERIAGMTEVGPDLENKGVVSAVPGRDDTSSILRRHHPNTGLARAQDVVEGNLDEPRDEARMDRKVDEGTAA
ncbi:MAG TPA: hypothetical protein VG225_05640 [Terracidiphilus sp.]|jgi:N utilization substance protein A|nr:hypothetical protein [Terracidiphilus sp.]